MSESGKRNRLEQRKTEWIN